MDGQVSADGGARAHTHTWKQTHTHTHPRLRAQEDEPDPRRMQVNLTGFLERNTGAFMGELWDLCISAQNNFRIQDGVWGGLMGRGMAVRQRVCVCEFVCAF